MIRASAGISAVACAIVGMALLATSGCAQTAQDSRSGSPMIKGLPAGVSLPSAVPTKVPNEASARRQVVVTGCQRTPSGWRADGSVSNNAGKPATYAITVFFTTGSGTVLGFGSSRLVVGPSAQAAWSVAADFAAPDDTACVLRGVARS